MMALKFIEPTRLESYLPIVSDVDFGDQEQFLISCAQYVGALKPRRRVMLANGEPDVWEQRIVYEDAAYPFTPVGITGWYRWPPFNEPTMWLGWFGVRAQFQRSGYGRAILEETVRQINLIYPAMNWLYVFTDSAAAFYEKCGFQKRGTCAELGMVGEVSLDATFKQDDIILRPRI